MSLLYSIREVSEVSGFETEVFILAGGSDDRALAMLHRLGEKENHVSKVLLIKNAPFEEKIIQEILPEAEIVSICADGDSVSFLNSLQDNEELFYAEHILMDITSIHIPELFTILKYLKLLNDRVALEIAYSTPIEYEFQAEPFTSYHSYYGNLKTIGLVGFGGMSEDMSHSQLVIFLGFEGVLSAKINEDVRYDKLTLVNNLPSFFEKYKDISMINNYDLLTTRHEKMAYVPANNPFETYNFLTEQLENDEPACVAPLSTKPVALGVCLYALSHDSLRVVYPVADEYNYHRANSIHNTYLYSIPLNTV